METKVDFARDHMVHGEEYYEPVKGLSPSRKDVPPHLSDSAGMDTHVTFVMDSLYSNDVQVDALRDDKEFHRDLDVLMELYHVDVKVDRCKGSSMVESQIQDLWKIDRLVDGEHGESVDDFVDTLTPKVMLQMEVQSHANLCKYDTSGVVNLLRTDMFVDGAKIDQEMMALVPLLEVDAMIDQCSKSKEYTSEAKRTKPLHLMDGTTDGCFKSLLETDKQVDGAEKHSSSELVDPYCHDAQGQDLIGTLFDVADLLRTDVEVDRQSHPKRGARLSTVAKKRDKYEEGEDLIVSIFGTFPNNPGSKVEGISSDTFKQSYPAKVPEKTANEKPIQKKGSLLSLFSLSNIPSMFKR